MRRISRAWVVLVICMTALAASHCYDQHGFSTTDTPCDSDSLPTFCCPSGYSCLSNGVCGKGTSLQMGSCSDQAWSGGSCIKYCPAGPNNIAVCKPQSSGSYCCGTGSSCCSGTDTFQLGVLSQASTLHFTTITSTPSAASSTPEWTSSSSVSVTATGLLIATTSSSQPESPTIVPTPSPLNASSARGMTTGSKIGIGAGVIGGVAVIGFLIYFLTFLLRSRRQEKYNRERVAQIQAKVRGTFSSDDTVNGNFDRLSSRGGAADFNISRTATPNSLRDSALRPLPPLPLQYDSSRQEPYAPYQQLSESFTHELWHLNPEAIAQHTQLPSHYSFSGPPVTEPVSPAEAPPRRMGTVQEYAAALPSHYSFSGTNATSPISPIEAPLPTSVSPIPTVAQLSFSGPPLTIPLSPAENSNEQPPPPRMTPIQEYAAAQLPSHYSFQAPPSVTSPVSPIEDPTRRPIGIQEMAAAQLPSHYSFSASPSG